MSPIPIAADTPASSSASTTAARRSGGGWRRAPCARRSRPAASRSGVDQDGDIDADQDEQQQNRDLDGVHRECVLGLVHVAEGMGVGDHQRAEVCVGRRRLGRQIPADRRQLRSRALERRPGASRPNTLMQDRCAAHRRRGRDATGSRSCGTSGIRTLPASRRRSCRQWDQAPPIVRRCPDRRRSGGPTRHDRSRSRQAPPRARPPAAASGHDTLRHGPRGTPTPRSPPPSRPRAAGHR